MTKQFTPLQIARHILGNDPFSQWMGVEIIEAAPGRSVLTIDVRKEMANGFGVTHGGITFALADSALAFAAGSHGQIALALDNNITYIKPVRAGDTLTASAVEEHRGRQIGVYNITVKNQDKKIVAVMRGTVYRTGNSFEL